MSHLLVLVSHLFLAAFLLGFTPIQYAECEGVVSEFEHNVSICCHYIEDEQMRLCSLSQADKIKELISGYYVHTMLSNEDLDGDGNHECLLRTASSIGHCCHEMLILTLTPQIKPMLRIQLNNNDIQEYEDLDGDGMMEIIFYDDRYSYFGAVCFACSPWVKVIANYDHGRLKLRPDLMRKSPPTDLEPMSKTYVALKQDSIALAEGTDSPKNAISMFLHLFYIGEYEKSLLTIKKSFIFQSSETETLFFEMLVESLSKSPFWNQIMMLNSLSHNDGRLYSSQEVVQELIRSFRRLNHEPE